MKEISKQASLALMLLAVSGWAGSHPSPNWKQKKPTPTNPNVAPKGLPDGPSALIQYGSEWNASVPKDPLGPHTHFCVMPFISIVGRKEGSPADRVKPQAQWTQAFDLTLVDAKGRPLMDLYGKPVGQVKVTPPIPANTTRELLSLPWCAVIYGATKPPEVYLQVEQLRARVIFDAPAPQAETR